MWEDPIVAEVHRTREKLVAEYNFDLGTFFTSVRKRQASLGSRLVSQKSKSEPTAETDGDCSGSSGSTLSESAPST